MEKQRKVWGTKWFAALCWGTLAVCAVCLVSFMIYFAELVVQTASYMYTFMDYFMVFYQYNMIIVIVLTILMIVLLFVKKKRETYARVFTWILLVLALFLTSAAIQSLASQLPQLVSDYWLFYIAGYLPSICMAVSLTALVSKLDASSKATVHKVSMVASIVAVFMLVFYLVWVANYSGSTDAFTTPQGLSSMLTLVCMTLVNVLVWYMTSSRHLFDKIVYAMSDVDAYLVESVEDKVQAAVAQMEGEILEGIAKEEQDAEEGGETKEKQEDKKKEAPEKDLMEELEDAVEEVAEEIEEVNEQLLGEDEKK